MKIPPWENDFIQSIDNLFYKNTDEKEIIIQKLEDILGNRRFSHGLDVGPGPGLVTNPLYLRCESLVLIELLSNYKTELENKYPSSQVITDSFLNYSPNINFDVILCSHIFYYFDDAQLEHVFNKLINCLTKNGMLIMILLDSEPIYKYFTKKLSHLFRVNFVNATSVMHYFSRYGKTECTAYYSKKFFQNDEYLNYYLHNFFALEDKKLLQECQDEIECFKRDLEIIGEGYSMCQKGQIVLFSRGHDEF